MRLVILALLLNFTFTAQAQNSWVRINLLGYTPNSPKIAVWCSKEKNLITSFSLIEVASGKTVFTGKAGKVYGGYGPFTETGRLNFTAFTKAGRYVIKAGEATSPEFTIRNDVYKGAANF